MVNLSQMIVVVVSFTQTHGKSPALALVGVGTQPEHGSFISLLRTHGMEVGIRFLHVELPIHISEAECVARVCELDQDPDIQDISVLLPLPTQIDERKVLAKISIEKNVDGVQPPSNESVSVEIVSCGEAFEPTTSTTSVVGRNHQLDDSDDSGKSKSEVVARNHEPDDSRKSKYEVNNLEHAEVSEKNEDDDDRCGCGCYIATVRVAGLLL